MNEDRREVCEQTHHWVSRHVPRLLIRWVIECSVCGEYNVDEMNEYTRQASEGWVA